MKVISVENVSKKFVLAHTRSKNLADATRNIFSRSEREDFWALKDVSFDVEQGEALGIIGHNGAGKSTMLKLLTRIMEPTSGRIRTRGRVSALIEVGAGFHPEMTGRENVYLNGSILGMTRREIDRKFDEIVAFAEIEKFIDTPVKRYSSGMYARLGFAVAAHVDPEILIVDEVLSVGDERFQVKCQAHMRNLVHGGATVLFVSHNLAAISALCGRAFALNEGEVVLRGHPDEVIQQFRLSGLATPRSKHSVPAGDSGVERRTVVIQSVSVRDGAGNPANGVPVGGEVIIEAGIVVSDRLPQANFGIEIHKDGHQCFVATSAMDGFTPELLPGEHKITFHVNDLQLVGGLYTVSIGVMDPGEMIHYHSLYSAAQFTVWCPQLYRGVAMLKHRWSNELVRPPDGGSTCLQA